MEWLGNGISQIVEFTPFLGFWVATGQLATGQKFSLTLLGQRELSRTEWLVILGSTGGGCIIGVATVVGGKYVVKVLGKTDTVAEAVRHLDNAPSKGIAGTRGLQHSFDRHAAEWFSRHGGTPSLAKWQEILETASKSTKIVEWSTGADKTIGKLARIDGNKWLFVQYFKEGPRAGEIATAFIPNSDQLRAILELLGK